MKAFECPVEVTPDGRIEIPPELAKRLPRGHGVRAIFLVSEPDSDEDADWARLTKERFAAGYSDADAVYDRV
jgi:hypothetical protein